MSSYVHKFPYPTDRTNNKCKHPDADTPSQ